MSLAPSQVVAPVDTSPCDLRPKLDLGAQGADTAADRAVLCLHGLTGTPYEVRPVADALVARGIRAKSIWMAGHNGSVDDLAQATREDWLERAREALLELQAEHKRVFLVGVSMGGLVSLRLAQQQNVDGLVVIGVPLRLAPPTPQLIPILRLLAKSKPKGPPGVEEPEARARHPRFPSMPFDSVRELIRLGKEVTHELAQIQAPILVAHGKRDRTATPRDAQRSFDGVSTQPYDKELFYLARSGHVATVDYDGPALSRAAADFIARC